MFDTDYILEDGAATKVASGYGQSGGEAAVANVGNGLVKANLIVDISQMAMGDSDELYQLHILGSSDESFTEEISLCCLEIGAKEVVEGSKDSKLGRYVVGASNEMNGVKFPYLRLRHVLAGTTAALTYKARLEKLTETTGFIASTVTTTTT
jgi:hypothetical protein